jgi:hypothetical protein
MDVTMSVTALILAIVFFLGFFPKVRPEVYRLYRITGHGRFESWMRSF